MGSDKYAPSSYSIADDMLQGRNRLRRKIAGETYLLRFPFGTNGAETIKDSEIALHYYNTDIVLYNPDGSLSLNSGGYRTVTTKQRINWALPQGWYLYQKDWEWFITQPDGTDIPFLDGMTVR